VFDIGLGEILILAVLGLLVFGPERLPRAAADAARTLRNVRAMASNARKDLADSAGVDLSGAQDALRDLQDLHPKRMVAGIFDDDAADTARKPSSGSSSGGASGGAGSTSARFDPDAT
jgi:sec-independent protein translocase protein TatB